MRFSFLLILTLFLVGCETKYVYIKERVAVDVPSSLFIHPDIPKPTPKEEYIKLSPSEKEVVLGTYSIELQKIIVSYKTIVNTIEEYINEQKEIIRKASEENKDAHLHR